MGSFIKDLALDNLEKLWVISFDNIIVPEVLVEYKSKLVFIAHSSAHVSMLSNLGLDFVTLSAFMSNSVNYLIPISPYIHQRENEIQSVKSDEELHIAMLGYFAPDNKDISVIQTLLNDGIQLHLFTLVENEHTNAFSGYPNFHCHVKLSTENIIQTIDKLNIRFMLCCPPKSSPFAFGQWSGVIAFAYNYKIPLIVLSDVAKSHGLKGCIEYTSSSDIIQNIRASSLNLSSIVDKMDVFTRQMYKRNMLLGNIILNRGFAPNELCTKTEYGGMYVLSNDIIGKKVLRGEYHEIQLINAVSDYVKGLDTFKQHPIVLDIGSNIGTTSLGFLKSCECNVISCEPQLFLAQLQKKTMELNNLTDRITIYNNAVGHKCKPNISMSRSLSQIDGLGRELDCDYTDDQTKNFGGLQIGKGGETVDMIHIDSLNVSPAVIKIDVEGAEKLVIWGARKTIERHRPLIIYENNWKTISDEMVSVLNVPDEILSFDIETFLQKCGYKIKTTIEDNEVWFP